MKLAKMRIQNLLSIRDTGEFPIQSVFAFVGENNTGKSNILRAADVLLSAGAGRLTRGDFHNSADPIIIKGEFDGLTDHEKTRWRKYLVDNKLILEKHISLQLDARTRKDKLDSEFHGYVAEPRDWFLSIQKIEEKSAGKKVNWKEIVEQNGLPEYFLEDGKSSKAIFSKALDKLLAENEVQFDAPDLSHTQALGLQSYAVANLPSVYLLPAITDYEDEIDRRSTTTTFRRLMAVLSERILERDPRFNEIQTALTTVHRLLNRLPGPGPQTRLDSLRVVEERIAELLRRVMPSISAVALSVEIEALEELFAGGVSIAINDGIETDVLTKGHGLQRCIVFTLLQTLILSQRNQLVPLEGEAPTTHPIILLIEEPELYLHPQLAKLFFDVMASFSENDQVIYTTHSPLFVDAYQSQNVAIVHKPDAAIGTLVKVFDAAAFDGLTEHKIFQGLSKLNPGINELFFARKVLLVEGPEDVIAVSATLQKLGLIASRVEEIEWSVVPCGGKSSIPFFQRVLNAFHIPYAVLHDIDIHEGMPEDKAKVHQKENEAIAALANGAPICVYPVKLEKSLGLAGHFRDQYEAHQFFLSPEKITDEVTEVIRSIFE